MNYYNELLSPIMRKTILFLSLSFLLSTFLFSQAKMTLWRVDETHLNNPATGLAYAFDCGDEY